MRNRRLLSEQPMRTVALASGYARRLVYREAERTGEPVKRVIAAVATRLHQPSGSIWGLLFRQPKTVTANLLEALEEAVEAEIKREIGALENELLAVRLGATRRDPAALEEIEAGIAELRAKLRGAS